MADERRNDNFEQLPIENVQGEVAEGGDHLNPQP